MQASRVSFFAETRDKLNNPILSKSRKKELKLTRVYEYIDSMPAGHKFKLAELGAAAGYRTDDKNGRAAAYAYIVHLGKSGKLNIEDTPKWHKEVTIPLSGYSLLPDSKRKPVTTTPAESLPPKDAPEDLEDDVLAKDIDFIIKVEKEARTFSWKQNSDSLREFVKSLK